MFDYLVIAGSMRFILPSHHDINVIPLHDITAIYEAYIEMEVNYSNIYFFFSN